MHNVGDKTEHSPPFPNTDNSIVEQRMPSMTTTLEDMTIQSSKNKDNDDKKRASEPRHIVKNNQATTSRVQPTIFALPPLAYNDLSPQGALIWQQLPERDKAILINITSEQRWESTNTSTIDAINGKHLDLPESTKNFTQKCCHRGTPSGELMQFREIVAHMEMDINDGRFCGSPYLPSILWQNGQITGVPIYQVMHDSPNECTKYMICNELSILGDDYVRIPPTTQLTHALMRLAVLVKKGDVPRAIELYDAFHFKFLFLDIYNSNKLMSEIHNKKINELLESINQRPFHQIMIQNLMCLISEARLLPTSTYLTPSMEVFDRDHVTSDDPEPVNAENNKELRKILLRSALDMKKLFPMRWTNEVHNKFVDIGIRTPQELHYHIIHGTLNREVERTI